MFRKECSLCGGKLRGNICVECGLDNSKSDDNYRTSKSHSDFEKMTHTHERFDPFAGKTLTKEQKKDMKNAISSRTKKTPAPSGAYRYAENNTMRKPKRGILGKVLGMFIVFFVFAGALVTVIDYYTIGDSTQSEWVEPDYTDEESYDPYEDAQYELAETGEVIEESLSAGEYIGGVHIPEGTYTVTLVEGAGNYNVVSEEHGIYIYESFDEDQYAEVLSEDLRIYKGAKLTVSESAILLLHSENASSDLNAIENPNTESFVMQGDFVVGDEVIPGVYDVYGVRGAGLIDFIVEFEDGTEAYGMAIVGEEGNEFFYPTVYKNLVLPEGTEIHMEDMTIELVPSEFIQDEDYLEYYR